ncbi:MAG: hypothetical protein HQL56_00315 [Magnetococcales bacterium]|nr:hypothetical protein [Magnetococcales bacterium]
MEPVQLPARSSLPVSGDDLQEREWVKPGACPLGFDEKGALWHPDDVVELASRGEWKRRGRHVLHHAVPLFSPSDVARQTPLIAACETLDEAEYRVYRLHRLGIKTDRWHKAIQRLKSHLSRVMTSLQDIRQVAATQSAVEAVLQTRERLAREATQLRQEAASIGEPQAFVPEESESIGVDRLLLRFREARLASVLSENSLENDEIVVAADRELGLQEERDARLLGYWEYYGRFTRLYESGQLEKRATEVTGVRSFHSLFPARERQRHFHLFLGPTNSGKTYQALQKLISARNGIYLAPLRLLAQEVAATLNEWGFPCDMITGEEQIRMEGARHVASTIEMLPLHRSFEVCVIDEAQMLGDSQRGWAWTQAILGVQADLVCVVGAPESRPVLMKLLALTGETWQETLLERMVPLEVLPHPVATFAELQPGTALVAFSRSAVLDLKRRIEANTRRQTAVVYGALPPEVRREQARLFASGEASFLASTDAIGMGLNLPIRTLLFAQDRKFIDRQEVPLTAMEIRQIAGRAGRFGKNEVGFVGTFHLPVEPIRKGLQANPPPISLAPMAPNLEQLLALADVEDRKDPSLARLLTLFVRTVRPDPEVYRLSDLDDQIALARMTDRYRQLDLSIRFTLSAAPVSLRSLEAVRAFQTMVQSVARGKHLALEEVLPRALPGPGEMRGLDHLEESMRVVNLYSWLHYRFSDTFPELEEAAWLRKEINGGILQRLKRMRSSEASGKPGGARFGGSGSGGGRTEGKARPKGAAESGSPKEATFRPGRARGKNGFRTRRTPGCS